jgi:hypothetical protein
MSTAEEQGKINIQAPSYVSRRGDKAPEPLIV